MPFNDEWLQLSLLQDFEEAVTAGDTENIQAARDFFKSNRGDYPSAEVDEAYEMGYDKFDKKRNKKI